MIVDADPVVARQLEHSLTATGYQIVGLAHTGEDAVQAAVLTRPDLVVLDLELPGATDGIFVAQQLRCLDIPAAGLTSYSDQDLLERAIPTEPLALLRKPVQIDEAAAVIRLALRTRNKVQAYKRWSEEDPASTQSPEGPIRPLLSKGTGCAIFTLDADGNINSWNAGAERVTGHRAEQTIGRPHSLLFPQDDREQKIPEVELNTARQFGKSPASASFFGMRPKAGRVRRRCAGARHGLKSLFRPRGWAPGIGTL